MPTFEITSPDGTKYRVTGENAEGAYQALQSHLGGAQQQKQPEQSYLESEYDKAIVGAQGMVEGLPVVGPFLKDASENIAGTVSSWVTGRPKEELLAEYKDRQEKRIAENQGDYVTGQIAGGVMPFLGVGMAPKGVQSALGMTGSLGARAVKSGASAMALSAADQAARDYAKDGELSLDRAAGSALVGGGLGAAIPVVGAAGGKAIGAGINKAGDFARSVLNPTKQAARKVGQAIDLDRAAGQGMSLRDVVRGRQNNQPLINADLGGETTRALTRAAANQSPEARGAIDRVVQDRFASQAARLSDKVRGLAGNADDLGTVDLIRRAASASNQPAYQKAFLSRGAQALYTPRLQQLMQAPAIRAAVKTVPKRSANRGAVSGFKEIGNPFELNSQGSYVLRQKADGSMVAPNLQFWDQVKRNLDDQIGAAQRSGNRSLSSDLVSLKNALVDELDKAVPDYKTARQGAAAFFQAEDAVEAGKKFFKSNRMIPEYRQGILKMTPEEREAFKVGFASEILDAAGATRDNQNVIGRYFNSPEVRQKIELAFGKPKAREFEAFVRVESAMDMLRNAMGNSTTARQLIESGIGGAGLGGATWWYTGDFNSGVAAAAVGAAGRMGARVAGKKINENVMKQTAEMLLSNDPKVMQNAIQMAAKSPQHMAALDAISQMLGLAARGGALQASTE